MSKLPNILAIDSSTEACSVALQYQGQVYKRFELAPRRHAELLLPMVDSVLTEANSSLSEIEAISCCVGPGAFTGLRIAISVAQGLSYAASLPCISVSSLEILAYQSFCNNPVNYCLSSIDARMKEVYSAVYQKQSNGLPEEVCSPVVIDPKTIQFDRSLAEKIGSDQPICKAGSGWDEYQYSEFISSLRTPEKRVVYPDASMMLAIATKRFVQGALLKPEFLQPLYLRNNVAKKKSEQK